MSDDQENYIIKMVRSRIEATRALLDDRLGPEARALAVQDERAAQTAIKAWLHIDV